MKTKQIILLILFFLLIPCFAISQNPKLDSLLNVADTATNLKKAKIYSSIANNYYYGVSVPKYLEYFQKSKHFAELAEDEEELIYALHGLGIAYHFSGKLDSAIINYQLVLKYTRKRKDTSKSIRTLRNIGISYQDLGLTDKSNSYYQEAFNLAKLSLDSTNMISVLHSMGNAYNDAMQFNSSVEVLLEAVNIAEETTDTHMISKVLNSLAITFGMMEDYDKALYYQRNSLLYTDKEADKRGLASSYVNLGLIFKKMNRLDSAEYYYNLSLDLKKEIGDIKGLLVVYDNIGSLHLVRKQYQEALNIYFEGLKFATDRKLINSQILLINDIGKTYFEMGNYADAEIYFLRGLHLAEKATLTEKLMELYHNLYKTNKTIGKPEEALYYNEKYHALTDSIFDLEKQKQLNDIETKYQTEKKESEILLLTKDKELQSTEIQKQKTLKLALAGLLALLVIVTVLIFSRYRLKQKNIRNHLEKEKLATEGKLLRSQMNPHFIFNSLNSIQSFISSNEPFKAMSYLSKFGKLTRDILEYSRESFITLDEEISSLELYIELETLRFKDDVKYSITVDKDIDIETTLIPPIIVQPFVENSLKHGLRQKEGEGLLEITFRFERENLICTVQDNGIGRKAAILKKEKGHHSLGMQITSERLHNLNRKAKSKTRYEIIDLYDDHEISAGTKVVILLPKEVN